MLLGQLKSEGTASLAKCLCTEGLTYSQIKAKYSESASYEAFSDWLKSAGVRYKFWHEKLHSHFKKECKNNYSAIFEVLIFGGFQGMRALASNCSVAALLSGDC